MGAAVAVVGQQSGPFAAAGEQEVDQFAYGALAGRGGRDPAGGGQHVGHRVGRGCRQGTGAHGGQIGPVVTDEGHFVQTDVELPAQRAQDIELVRDALEDVADAQLLGALGDDVGVASGDDGQFDACPVQQRQAKAVADREGFGDLALRADPDAAVGQGAVDVHGQQAHLPGCGE